MDSKHFRHGKQAVRKSCKHCETRRDNFRKQGMATWDPYYALCYSCYRRHLSHQSVAPRTQHAAA
jgi:hypothetical protein